jgi:hypothetical protein
MFSILVSFANTSLYGSLLYGSSVITLSLFDSVLASKSRIIQIIGMHRKDRSDADQKKIRVVTFGTRE